MYVMVDDSDAQAVVEGFMYTNDDGDLEGVSIHENCLALSIGYADENAGQRFTVYGRDVPKMIRALQSALAHTTAKQQ
jgi:hypothetical protein